MVAGMAGTLTAKPTCTPAAGMPESVTVTVTGWERAESSLAGVHVMTPVVGLMIMPTGTFPAKA